MVIAYDNSYSGTAYGGESVSRAFTVGSDADRYLVAFLYGYSSSDAGCDYTNVQYNSVSMTLIGTLGTNRYGNYCKCSVYYLLAPTSGSNNFTCDADAAMWNGGIHLLSLSGVDQGAPEATNTNYDNASSLTSFSSSVTTVTDGAWVIDGLLQIAGSASTMAADSGQTEHSSPLSLTSTVGAGLSTELQPTAGSETQGWSWTDSSNMVLHYLLSLAPSAAGEVTIETGNVAQGNAGGTTAHTLTTNSNRGVLVLIDDESTSQASAVTYNGASMTLVAASTATTGAGNASSMWFILDADLPAGGSSYNVSVTGLDSGASVSVVELNNVAQVIPSGAAVDTTETGATNTSSATVTAPDGNSISVGILGQGAYSAAQLASPPTGTGTWTRLFTINNPPSSAELGCGYQLWTTSGSKTYTESLGVGTDWFRASQIHAVFAVYSSAAGEDNAPFFGCNI